MVLFVFQVNLSNEHCTNYNIDSLSLKSIFELYPVREVSNVFISVIYSTYVSLQCVPLPMYPCSHKHS